MKKTYRISELIFDNEEQYYKADRNVFEEEKSKKRIREVLVGNKIRHLTRIDNAEDIKSIKTPDGRELTSEELFNFVIGEDITDLARTENKDKTIADIAIVLGNITLATTRERAIKAFELYKLGLVKRIIFTGGVTNSRDKKGYMIPKTLEGYMSNEIVQDLEWEDLSEADWGAETFVEEEYDENYQKHSSKLTDKLFKEIVINPEDVLTESMSTTTQENAEFCKNIFSIEEIETGKQVKTAIIVTTCTHGKRATKQFEKVFKDEIKLKWCPSTLDLERYESLKSILKAPKFNEIAFKNELKRLYCTEPELIQKLREEVGQNRNVFIKELIDEPVITVIDKEKTEDFDDVR